MLLERYEFKWKRLLYHQQQISDIQTRYRMIFNHRVAWVVRARSAGRWPQPEVDDNSVKTNTTIKDMILILRNDNCCNLQQVPAKKKSWRIVVYELRTGTPGKGKGGAYLLSVATGTPVSWKKDTFRVERRTTKHFADYYLLIVFRKFSASFSWRFCGVHGLWP